MRKIIVVEPSKDGAEHLTFNSLVLSSLIGNSFESIILAASKSHYEALGRPKVTFIPLPVVSIVKRRFIRKVLVELFAILKSMMYAKRNGIQYAIFLSTFPPLLNFLSIIAKLFGVSTLLILHGELEGLVDSSRIRITSFGYWVRRFFECAGYKRIVCLVLSEGIHRRLLTLYPSAEDYVKWANHPLVENKKSQNTKREFDIATVGVATQRKHGPLFEKLENISFSGRRVAHVGMSELELFERHKKKITFFCDPGDYLSHEKFISSLKRVKYAIFPYSHTSYQMTVSGAMLDAISCGCKIVCLPNDFAKDLLQAGLPVTIAGSFDSLLHPVEQIATCEIPWQEFSPDAFRQKLLSCFS